MANMEEMREIIYKAHQEHLRKMKEDPKYRKEYEETSRRLDRYYAFGTKQKGK